MKIFKIVKDSDKNLRKKCLEVSLPLDEETKNTLLEMIEYLKISQDEEKAKKYNIRSGVGLAAPQIGIQKRMLAIYVQSEDQVYEYALVNPKIISESFKMAYIESGEGCLSVDKDHKGYVYRHYKIKVNAFNALTNKEETIEFKGYLAIVAQHEIDHLDGILYYDRINKLNPFEHRNSAISI